MDMYVILTQRSKYARSLSLRKVGADKRQYVKYVPLLLVGAALDPTARGMAPGRLHSGPLRLERLGELLPASGPELA